MMATRSSGSSRKPAKISPMNRLVAALMALALGRSSTTSKTAPERVTRNGPSDMSFLPGKTNERIDGDRAASHRTHEQRVDIELDEAVGVGGGKILHRHRGIDCGADIALRAAAIALEERRQLQRADRRLDLVAAGAQHQGAAIGDQLGENATGADHEIEADGRIAGDADDELG